MYLPWIIPIQRSFFIDAPGTQPDPPHDSLTEHHTLSPAQRSRVLIRGNKSIAAVVFEPNAPVKWLRRVRAHAKVMAHRSGKRHVIPAEQTLFLHPLVWISW
jgi:hypothetical protein